MAVKAAFEAHLVLGFDTLQAKLSLRLLAAAFATWLHQHHWLGIFAECA